MVGEPVGHTSRWASVFSYFCRDDFFSLQKPGRDGRHKLSMAFALRDADADAGDALTGARSRLHVWTISNVGLGEESRRKSFYQ